MESRFGHFFGWGNGRVAVDVPDRDQSRRFSGRNRIVSTAFTQIFTEVRTNVETGLAVGIADLAGRQSTRDLFFGGWKPPQRGLGGLSSRLVSTGTRQPKRRIRFSLPSWRGWAELAWCPKNITSQWGSVILGVGAENRPFSGSHRWVTAGLWLVGH